MASTKRMVCIDCGMRIKATMRQAKQHGWKLWVGGASCKRCQQTGVAEQKAAIEKMINEDVLGELDDLKGPRPRFTYDGDPSAT